MNDYQARKINKIRNVMFCFQLYGKPSPVLSEVWIFTKFSTWWRHQPEFLQLFHLVITKYFEPILSLQIWYLIYHNVTVKRWWYWKWKCATHNHGHFTIKFDRAKKKCGCSDLHMESKHLLSSYKYISKNPL